ncbi:hypothetical protein PPERSA_10368 [Pseudocohnilembus persalinus]|uniref:Uncharacterized protein n=1 Tax=Pseudocohnilembus persalinus TaxID=266149 RepID=A0A0V0QN86_PSEPJ|nr:hypothetical protein PPERSA_10368 [Pseudocohnilembus persalinus]|eukprot:KRX03684.1 hypothetical protein PPERSA_10368 [Pseudocohnilembus persalinus]
MQKQSQFYQEIDLKALNALEYQKNKVTKNNGKQLKRRKHKKTQKEEKLCCSTANTSIIKNCNKKASHWAQSSCGIGREVKTAFMERVTNKIEAKKIIKSYFNKE